MQAGANTVQKVTDAVTYQPTTDTGKGIVQGAGSAVMSIPGMETVANASKNVGDYAESKGAGPAVSALAAGGTEAAINAVPFLKPVKLAQKALVPVLNRAGLAGITDAGRIGAAGAPGIIADLIDTHAADVAQQTTAKLASLEAAGMPGHEIAGHTDFMNAKVAKIQDAADKIRNARVEDVPKIMAETPGLPKLLANTPALAIEGLTAGQKISATASTAAEVLDSYKKFDTAIGRGIGKTVDKGTQLIFNERLTPGTVKDINTVMSKLGYGGLGLAAIAGAWPVLGTVAGVDFLASLTPKLMKMTPLDAARTLYNEAQRLESAGLAGSGYNSLSPVKKAGRLISSSVGENAGKGSIGNTLYNAAKNTPQDTGE
jgi:hypothetical protein